MIEFGVHWCCFITRFHEQEHQAVSLRYTLHHDIKRDGNKTEIDAWVGWIDGRYQYYSRHVLHGRSGRADHRTMFGILYL